MSLIIKSTFAERSAMPSFASRRLVRRTLDIVLPVADPRADEIAVIAHELRNSLAVVRNAALLLRHPNAVDGARILIERHVGQMTRHIDDLLESSLLAVRRKTLNRSHVDLRTIVQFSISAVATDLARRGHRLVVHQPAEELMVDADASRIEQVFSNLLNNAAKYTPDGGTIGLTMERINTRISVCIRDSGIGMDPAQLPRVFDMFAQANALAPCSEGGSGIGLAVVRDLVEMHGGSVHASSAGLGLGSEFTVLLPALPPAVSTG